VRLSVLFACLVAAALVACRRVPSPAAGKEAPPPPIEEAALDRATPPCQDFFRFACGGWLDRTEIPADRAFWHRGFAEVDQRNKLRLRRILEEAAAGRGDRSHPFVDALGAFYGSCMDEAGIEERGLSELKAEWARIDAVDDRSRLAEELARLHAAGVQAPFPLYSTQDAKDATQVILTLAQGGLTLPDREFYLSEEGKFPELRRELAAHLRRMLQLAGVPATQADAQARAIEGLERALAETHWTRTERRDPTRTYNRVDRPGLEKLAPALPWARFFEGLDHPALAAVSVETPRFVEEAGKLFEARPLEDWKAYLRWHLLDEMARARALPKAFVEESFRLESKALTGAKELLPRWKHCVDATDRALGFALGRIFVARHFGTEGKDRTTRLVGEVEKAMGRDLERLPWMDAATREGARRKIATLRNKVGYPETGRDYSTLAVSRKAFLPNVLAAARFETNRRLDQVGKPLDRTEWFMTPPTVNAYYDASMNEIVFPAGILQPPFFNRAAPEAVNYGAIGMVVGHELTHGFDDQGRQYDADGNLVDWWTPAVSKEFDARAQCIVDQYGSYETLPGVRLNGKLTLGENIADLGGLRLAFAALQAARRSEPGADATVAGFSPDQQFFVGYAQSWCAKYREENLRLRAVTDPHSPARYRVNGPLSNMREFAAAFGCTEGTPMVRPAERRCEVW
jgi:endothelin-converting enzyme/putative endopeptidase